VSNGKIVNVELLDNNTSLLSIELDGKTFKRKFNGELQQYKGMSIRNNDGKWAIVKTAKKRYKIRLDRRKDLGSILGVTHSTSFDFKVIPQLDEEVSELTFVVTKHKQGVALGQITNIKRNQNEENIAHVEIFGIYGKKNLMLPRTPFFQNTVVKQAIEDDVNAVLSMDAKEGLYLGKIHETNIPVYVDSKKILSGGVNVFAVKGAGKTYMISVLCEELTKKGIPVVIIDPHGEYYFKQPNMVNEELQKAPKFGIKPRIFTNQAIFTFSKQINPLADAEIAYKHLAKESFYTDFLVKPGQISILNLRGLPVRVQRVQVAKFLNLLFELRKTGVVPPFALVVEELKKFAPQKGQSIACLKSLEDYSSEGRKFGIGVCLISQRPADVNKSVVGQTENYIILRMGYDKTWVSKNVMGAKKYDHLLDKLPIGTAYASGLFDVPLLIDIRIRESLHFGANVDVSSRLFEGEGQKKNNLQKDMDALA